MITLETKVNIPKDVICTQVESEMVLLDLVKGKYFSLDEIGTRMWVLLGEHQELKTVLQALVQEYNASPEELEHDLLALTDQLVTNNLLVVRES